MSIIKGIRDKIQMFHNTNRTKYNKKIQMKQNTNTTKCKCKHNKIQMEQNTNTTKCKDTKIQTLQNTIGTFGVPIENHCIKGVGIRYTKWWFQKYKYLSFCILSCLYFGMFVFLNLCILFYLYFVPFVFCCICILLHLYFVTLVFCYTCILAICIFSFYIW